MGTTTKMAIPYPEATGLVKDGWEDMKDIATQVDAKSGLVLLNTTSFSSVASQSISNVFSSTFDNYLIQVRVTAGTNSVDSNVTLRMRTTVDESGSIYRQRANSTNASGTLSSYGSGTQTQAFISDMSNGNKSSLSTIWISNPFNSSETLLNLLGQGYNFGVFGGVFIDSTTSYTGFTLIQGNSNNMTGFVSVFGVNK